MPNKKQNNNIDRTFTIGILVICFLLLTISLLYTQWSKQENFVQKNTFITTPSPHYAQELREFTSDTLHFAIKIPVSFAAEESINTLTLKKTSAELLITRIGTNFNTIEDYVNDLAQKNKFTVTNQETQTVNGLHAIKGDIHHASDTEINRTYFIYTNYQVYTFTTESPELFNDLDQIAQSFEYTP